MSNTFNSLLKVNDFLFKQKHFLIGTSILRIVAGIHIMFTYVIYFFERDSIWGNNSFIPHEVKMDYITLYSLNTSSFYFESIFLLGLVINVLFTVGYYTKMASIFNFIFVYSLYNANPYILDGGNNILMIILFFMMFIKLDSYFSVKPSVERNNEYLNLIHNFAVFLCLFQVCILYFFAGLFKAQGDMWIHGTAIYYILNVDEFTQPFLAKYILMFPSIVAISSVSAVFFQIFFPFLIFNKYTKIPMLFASICFHLGIIFIMGLIQFGLIMIALDLLFVTDKEHKSAIKFLKKVFKKDVIDDKQESINYKEII
ncbi:MULTISPECIES: HTTM domain-containing protein [unclassified Exiguobacterium]|uniref:HTTM domain-containing protein n=1 Tax=unclassified Exiguobacterium TaxID=2644629 RepID=UPI001BE8D590|nr:MULTISPECIES: HTTM domain-containing protein [unclassified Exiguobacterium]